MFPTLRPVDPDARCTRSRRITSVRPSFARGNAMLVPMTPPPAMTTSARSVMRCEWSEGRRSVKALLGRGSPRILSEVRGRDHLVVEAVHLEGRMGDAEAVAEPGLNRIHEAGGFLNCRIARYDNVPRERIQARCQGPDVQFMDAADARHACDRPGDVFRTDVGGGGLQDNATPFAQQ